jgi:hypothetical protein
MSPTQYWVGPGGLHYDCWSEIYYMSGTYADVKDDDSIWKDDRTRQEEKDFLILLTLVVNVRKTAATKRSLLLSSF